MEGLLFPSTETRYYDSLPDNPDYILCQVDPADEGKDRTCSAIYFVKDGLVYVADVLYLPDNADITVPLIIGQIKRFGPSRVHVESNAACAATSYMRRRAHATCSMTGIWKTSTAT